MLVETEQDFMTAIEIVNKRNRIVKKLTKADKETSINFLHKVVNQNEEYLKDVHLHTKGKMSYDELKIKHHAKFN